MGEDRGHLGWGKGRGQEPLWRWMANFLVLPSAWWEALRSSSHSGTWWVLRAKIFTDKVKYNVQHLTGVEELDGVNPKLMKDLLKARHHLDNDEWGYFKRDIGPRRYKNLVEAMARVNLATIDAKVSIDLKRILRLPSSLHSKVSMKCMEVKNRETFDPFKEAVPKFVYERDD